MYLAPCIHSLLVYLLLSPATLKFSFRLVLKRSLPLKLSLKIEKKKHLSLTVFSCSPPFNDTNVLQ